MHESAAMFRRSPHLLVTWRGSELLLVQCDHQRHFVVDDRLLGLLCQLENWTTWETLAEDNPSVTEDALSSLVELGVVVARTAPAGGGSGPPWWSEFDLAVHRQQNQGPPERPAGERTSEPPPAFKDPPSGHRTTLPAPGELPDRLDDLLARRRSVRAYGDGPLPLGHLSTLLHHSARVIDVVCDDELGEQALRPYPGGGARSELELYIVANDVDGLAPGAHYFDARAHQLVAVRPRDDYQASLNEWVVNATGASGGPPQALILVTAVFARVMWKYRWVGLGLVYADTGCLYQTLYLAATALGLAPCAIGSGPEADNAHWLGLDPLQESQVGCFVVGVAPRGPAEGELADDHKAQSRPVL